MRYLMKAMEILGKIFAPVYNDYKRIQMLRSITKIDKKIAINSDNFDHLFTEMLQSVHVDSKKNNHSHHSNNIWNNYWLYGNESIGALMKRAIKFTTFFAARNTNPSTLHEILNRHTSSLISTIHPSNNDLCRLYTDLYKQLDTNIDAAKVMHHIYCYYDHLVNSLSQRVTSSIYDYWLYRKVLQSLVAIINENDSWIQYNRFKFDKMCIICPDSNTVENTVEKLLRPFFSIAKRIMIDRAIIGVYSYNHWTNLICTIIERGINGLFRMVMIDNKLTNHTVIELFLNLYEWIMHCTIVIPYDLGDGKTIMFVCSEGVHTGIKNIVIHYNKKLCAAKDEYRKVGIAFSQLHKNDELSFVQLMLMIGSANRTNILNSYLKSQPFSNMIGGIYKLSIIENKVYYDSINIVNMADSSKTPCTDKDLDKVNHCFQTITFNGSLQSLVSEINYYYNSNLVISALPKSFTERF